VNNTSSKARKRTKNVAVKSYSVEDGEEEEATVLVVLVIKVEVKAEG